MRFKRKANSRREPKSEPETMSEPETISAHMASVLGEETGRRSRLAVLAALAVRLLPSLFLFAAGVDVASAEDVSAARVGRFTMVPAEGGFVRLDTETGIVSHCRRSAEGAEAGWQCIAIPDSVLVPQAQPRQAQPPQVQLPQAQTQQAPTLQSPEPQAATPQAATPQAPSLPAQPAPVQPSPAPPPPAAAAPAAAPDRLAELGDTVDALSREVAQLRMRLDQLAAARAPPPKIAPSTQDERALDFSEELMRRFFGMVREWRRSEAEDHT